MKDLIFWVSFGVTSTVIQLGSYIWFNRKLRKRIEDLESARREYRNLYFDLRNAVSLFYPDVMERPAGVGFADAAMMQMDKQRKELAAANQFMRESMKMKEAEVRR